MAIINALEKTIVRDIRPSSAAKALAKDVEKAAPAVLDRLEVRAAKAMSPEDTLAAKLKDILNDDWRLKLSNYFNQVFGKRRDYKEIKIRELGPSVNGFRDFLGTAELRTHFPDQDYILDNAVAGRLNETTGQIEGLQKHRLPLWLLVENTDNSTLREVLAGKFD